MTRGVEGVAGVDLLSEQGEGEEVAVAVVAGGEGSDKKNQL
jgi:hypothetical protein